MQFWYTLLSLVCSLSSDWLEFGDLDHPTFDLHMDLSRFQVLEPIMIKDRYACPNKGIETICCRSNTREVFACKWGVEGALCGGKVTEAFKTLKKTAF